MSKKKNIVKWSMFYYDKISNNNNNNNEKREKDRENKQKLLIQFKN